MILIQLVDDSSNYQLLTFQEKILIFGLISYLIYILLFFIENLTHLFHTIFIVLNFIF